MRSELCVLKFGGSSLSTPEKIQSVAQRIAALARQGRRLVVVVSAMGQTTDELVSLAHRVSPHPNRRELDMLLTAGERISMALMSMALHDCACPSISFTGSQAGVMTNGSFSNAEIVAIRPIRVAQELRRGRVVVLAGFQGVDPRTKEITTLGRGGSDTTAIAMASVLGAKRCEIYKDVDGIYGADPKLIPNAPFYKKIPLHLLHEFCHWGAKVLNVRSVEWAMKSALPIFIGKSSDFSLGTSVTTKQDKSKLRQRPIVGLHSHSNVLEVLAGCKSLPEITRALQAPLQPRSLPQPNVLHREKIKNGFRLFLTLDAESLAQIRHELNQAKYLKVIRDDLSSIALTSNRFSSTVEAAMRSSFNGSTVCHFSTNWSRVMIIPSNERLDAMSAISEKIFSARE